MPLPITGLYTALFLIWLLCLTGNVVRLRLTHKVALGDGHALPLQQAIRAHGNATESVPVVLIGLGLLEGLGAASLCLHGLGLAFLLGRLLHGWGILRPGATHPTRQAGMLLTWAVMLALALLLLWKATAAMAAA